METEFEAKFYPVDKDKIRKALKKLGAKLIKPERKMKRVITDCSKRKGCKFDYLRVRDEGDGVIKFSIKIIGHEGSKVSDQKELAIKVDSFDNMVEALEHLGYKPTKYQESLRETWDYKGAEVEIETWPGLKPFIEIEAKSEGTVKRLAEKLGFTWEEKIILPVNGIFAKVYGLTNEEVLKRLEYITFEKIPF